MKKCIVIIFIVFVIQSIGIAQSSRLVRLWHELDTASQDTSRVLIMARLTNYYMFSKTDSAFYYGNSAVVLARRINFPRGETLAMNFMAMAQQSIGNYANALKIGLHALKIAEKNKLIGYKATALLMIGNTYKFSKNYNKALIFLRESRMLYDSLRNDFMSIISKTYIGETYLKMNQLDSALEYTQLAYDQAVSREDVYLQYYALRILAQIQHKRGNTDLALSYFWHALRIANTGNHYLNPNLSIARLYQQINLPDSSIYYAKRSLEIAQESGFYSSAIDASILLSEIYEKRDLKKAFQFNKIAITYKDSLDYLRSSTSMEAFTNFDEQERQYELEAAKAAYDTKVQRLWIFSFAGGLISAIILSLVLYWNNKNKQKANTVLKEQKEEIQSTLEKLESTQSQLIQSEKMASLGELTAGIAHEIQNPLNFVN
ncbi:MAG: tetratricopeptide repeat protein, partial [Cyclobacteriaceae bacterium]|nr:tetratricopeptide repeat protein [Cyclobacteriaceae bacterium]